MKKMLVTIDGLNATRTHAAVAEAVRLWNVQPVEVHLLSVQPRVSSHVAMFFPAGELHRTQEAAGLEELKPAQVLLAQAGVPCTSSVRVGRRAETIARVARELGCDAIVVGQDSQSLAGRMLGSVANQVRELVGASSCQVIGT